MFLKLFQTEADQPSFSMLRGVCVCVCLCASSLTFAGGLLARPGSVGEAYPLGGAVERVARVTGEAHLTAELETSGLAAGVCRRAGIPTAPRALPCRETAGKGE